MLSPRDRCISTTVDSGWHPGECDNQYYEMCFYKPCLIPNI